MGAGAERVRANRGTGNDGERRHPDTIAHDRRCGTDVHKLLLNAGKQRRMGADGERERAPREDDSAARDDAKGRHEREKDDSVAWEDATGAKDSATRRAKCEDATGA